MVKSVPDVLARIVAHKRVELEALRPSTNQLENAAASRPPQRDLRQRLEIKSPAVIAEIKKASPSKGLLSAQFEPARIASAYRDGGASALSVLTDIHFFQGKLEDLQEARAAVDLPVLRKDFTLDPLHVVQAAAHGADAILLIAAILTPEEMRSLRELADSLHLAALVEVHDEEELRQAMDSGATILGVNNRNLHTFEVTLDTSLRLADLIPNDVLRVSESGIHSSSDIRRLQDAGFQAFLVGEHLMKAPNPADALRSLLQ